MAFKVGLWDGVGVGMDVGAEKKNIKDTYQCYTDFKKRKAHPATKSVTSADTLLKCRKSGNLFSKGFPLTLLHEGLNVGCETVGFKLGLSDGVEVGMDVGAEKKYKK